MKYLKPSTVVLRICPSLWLRRLSPLVCKSKVFVQAIICYLSKSLRSLRPSGYNERLWNFWLVLKINVDNNPIIKVWLSFGFTKLILFMHRLCLTWSFVINTYCLRFSFLIWKCYFLEFLATSKYFFCIWIYFLGTLFDFSVQLMA